MKIIHLSLLALVCLLGLTNCKKDKPDCGCSAETISTFTDATGMLNFDSVEHRYVIFTPYVGGVQRNFVCDSTVGKLSAIFPAGPNSVRVRFSGELAKYCTLDTVAYIDLPRFIRLSSISQ